MIINDFNIVKVAALEHKTDTILIIDPNAVLSLAVTLKRLKPIPRRDTQIPQASCITDHDQFS